MKTASIRQARASEATALTELAMRSKAHWGYSQEFMAACRDEMTVREADLSAGHLSFRVRDHNGAPAGYYCLERLGEAEFELDALFVEPAHIGRGFGRELLTHATGLAGSLGGQTLLIQGDPHAQAFYLAAGAELVGTRPSGSIPDRELPLFRMALSS